MATTTILLARPPPPPTSGDSGLVVALALVAGGAAIFYAWTVTQAQATNKADAKINSATQWTSTSASIEQPVYPDTKTPVNYVPRNSIPLTADAGAFDNNVNSNAGSVYVKKGKTEVAVKGPSMGVPVKVMGDVIKSFSKLWK